MIIDITLNDDLKITSNYDCIGKVSENKSTLLRFHVTDFISTLNFYLDFEKPNGNKFTTSRLDIVEKVVDYEVTNSLLDDDGFLKMEVVLTGSNDQKIIYPTLTFKIIDSINATDSLPDENPILMNQIQDLLNLVETDGDGTQYLSNDGTYKTVSGGSSDYNELTNKPLLIIESMDNTNPIILRNLDSGLYDLHGWFRPFTGSEILMAAQTPILAAIAKSSNKSFIQLFFPFNNIVQYLEITDDDFTSKNISLNNLLERIEALEAN